MHDTPGRSRKLRSWTGAKAKPNRCPAKPCPNLTVVTRDYPNVHRMMTALGPLATRSASAPKALLWKADEEYADLKEKLGIVTPPG